MKSRRQDHVITYSSLPLSSVEGMSDEREKMLPKSKIPQMLSPVAGRRRVPPKKPVDSAAYEATRPKSATTRLPSAHPVQQIQSTRQSALRAGKERLVPKQRLPYSSKNASPSYRSTTPVIKIPMSPVRRPVPVKEDVNDSVCSKSDRDIESNQGEHLEHRDTYYEPADSLQPDELNDINEKQLENDSVTSADPVVHEIQCTAEVHVDAEIPAKNNADEPVTPAKNDDINDVTEDFDPELIRALGAFEADAVEWGENIHEDIARHFQPILLNGLKKEVKEELNKRYLFPKNVPLAKAPALNPEIAAMLTEACRNRDKRILSKQEQIGKAFSGLGKAMTVLLKKETNIAEVIRTLNDVGKLVADAHFAETDTRRSVVIPLVEKSLIDPFKDRKRDSFLFGEKLGDLVKNSRGIKKTGQLIQAPSTASTSSTSLNWRNPPPRPRLQRGGQQPYPNRGGGHRGFYQPRRRGAPASNATVRRQAQAPPPPPPAPRRQARSSRGRRPANLRHRAAESKSDQMKMKLKMRWKDNIAKFESIKRQLDEKQRGLLELYATLQSWHKELSDMGQQVYLPSSDDLKIMNVAQLAPNQLLQLCTGPEDNDATKNSIDLRRLCEIPNNIVATCEKTLTSRKDIIDWFEDVMTKKMITKQNLEKKIKQFKTENEEFKRLLDKNKVDYMHFLSDNDQCFKKNANNSIVNTLRFQSFSYKLSELNTVNENLRKKLTETEEHVRSGENTIRELEKQIKDERLKKNKSKNESPPRAEEEKIAHIKAALAEAESKRLTLEKTVSELREENNKIQSMHDRQMKKLNESIGINTKLFNEITADRSQLQTEKLDLQKQIIELNKTYEEALRDVKNESSSTVAKLIETEKKLNEVKEEKLKLEFKTESLCAQLLDSELRFKDVSKKMTELELNLDEAAEYRKVMDVMKYQLENAQKELRDYKELATIQKQAIQELEKKIIKAVNTVEQLENDRDSKEKHILKFKKEQSILEQRLRDSELKTESYVNELSRLKSHVNQLQEDLGGYEFENWEELHEMVKRQNTQLKEANQQNTILSEKIIKKDFEIQQQVETATHNKHLLEERDAAIKKLTDTNEEQANIITLLRNNLDSRTQADIEFNQQIAKKNSEIESLMNNVDKRKEQITQLEKIIVTLEDQVAKLKEHKRTGCKTISTLEKKLNDYESYYTTNARKAEFPANRLDDIINILEDELANPSEGQMDYPSREYLKSAQKLSELKNNQRTHNNYNGSPEKLSCVYQCQENMPSKTDANSYVVKASNPDRRKGDSYGGNQGTSTNGDRKCASPTKIHQHTRNVDYQPIPDYVRDERKLRMFKLAGHRLH